MIIVSDTTPIISSMKAGQLEWKADYAISKYGIMRGNMC